jgi:hypothetical protein
MARKSKWKRDVSKERAWRRWLAQWRSSGVSVRAYCRGRGLSEAQFHFWRRELGLRDREASVARGARAFAAVEVTSAALVGDLLPRDGVEIVLAGGSRVRVRSGFDRATLSEVLAVLRGCAC